MPGEKPQNGPETIEKLPLDRLVQEYTQTYRRILARENNTSGDELRRRLDQFREQQNLPELNDEQRQNEAFLKSMMVLADAELEPVRQKLVAVMFDQLEKASPEQRDDILLNLTGHLKDSEIADVFLLDELIRRRFERVTNHIVDFLKNPEKTSPEVIRRGVEIVQEDGDRNITTPQETAFGLYTFSTLVQKTHPDILRQLAVAENKNIDAFARLTFASYQEFLQAKGLDPQLFCPGFAWYRRLCDRSQIMARLNTIDVHNYPVVTAFNGDMEAQAREWERQAREYLKIPGQEGLALQLENRAKGLRELGKSMRESVESINIADSINPQDIQVMPALERAVENPTQTLSEIAESPSKLIEGFFKLVHQPIEGAATLGEKFGDLIPEPQQFRNMDAGSMLTAGGKLALVLAAAVNMAGIGVTTWNNGAKFLRNLILERDPKAAIGVIPGYIKSLWEALPSTGATTGAALFFASREGNLHDLDHWLGEKYDDVKTWVKRAAGHEYFANTAHHLRDAVQWTISKAGPLLEQGKEGFDEYIWKNGADLYQSLRDGASENWEALGLWAEGVGVNLEKYKEHFQTMSAMQEELNAYFRQQGVDITSRTITVSTEKFNQFLLKYIENNRDARNPVIKDIDWSSLKEMQFISERNLGLLPQGAPAFRPSPALAKRFIEQGVWWRNRLASDS